MNNVIRIISLAMVAMLLLCAAGCGEHEDKTKTAAGSATAESTLPVVEGVEDWEGAPTQQPTGQTTPDQPTAQQPTTGQQTGDQEQPDASKSLTLAEYEALTTAQQQAYFESFDSPDAFYEWLEAAQKAAEEQGNTVTGDGTLDLNDYINK